MLGLLDSAATALASTGADMRMVLTLALTLLGAGSLLALAAGRLNGALAT